MNKLSPKYNLYNIRYLLYYYGLGIIGIFVVIFFISAIIKGEPGYLNFFFNNIKNNIFWTVITGFHVSMLGFGILLILISVFNMSPMIKCFNDRFEILNVFQKAKTVYYKDIKSVNVKVFYIKNKNILRNNEKECRVFFINNTYNFYLAYPVKGYFDDVEINLEDNILFSRKTAADKWIIDDLLSEIKNVNKIKIPPLPEESKK